MYYGVYTKIQCPLMLSLLHGQLYKGFNGFPSFSFIGKIISNQEGSSIVDHDYSLVDDLVSVPSDDCTSKRLSNTISSAQYFHFAIQR